MSETLHKVGISTNPGSVEAWVFDLPGCHAGATSISEVRDILPAVISEHLLWLERHGEAIDDGVAFEVTEEVDAPNSGAADGEFCFEADRVPASTEEIETAVHRMGYARDDLLAVVDGLPDIILDWTPPASALAWVDSWAPEVRSIRGIIRHIASGDFYYRTGLQEEQPPPDPPDELNDLALQRARAIDIIRSLSDEQRARVYRPRRPWQQGIEEWTVRKALRRIIIHERFHTKEIEQRLAWLLLSVPSFQRGVATGPK